MSIDKLQKLEDIVNLLGKDTPSTQEVAEAIKAVLEAIQKVRTELLGKLESKGSELSVEIKASLRRLDDFEKNLETKLSNLKTEGSKDLNTFKEEVKTELKKIESLIPEKADFSEIYTKLSEVEAKIPQVPAELVGEQLRDKLEALDGDERLDKSAIKGLEDLEKELKNTSKGGVTMFGSRGIQLYVGGTKKGLVQMVNIIAGTNVSITHNTANGRNDITISATGGSGSFAVLAATGDIDDSNTTFTFVSEPTLVIVNGASYRDGHGCSITGTTVELDNPVGVGGDIYALG